MIQDTILGFALGLLIFSILWMIGTYFQALIEYEAVKRHSELKQILEEIKREVSK